MRYALVIGVILVAFSCREQVKINPAVEEEAPWQGWNKYQIKPEDTIDRYGRELIENTAYYLGPKGKVAALSNGMNCQNCHLDAGTRPWANNFSAVVSTYPKLRARSGRLETIAMRVNDCMERSLNGKALDSNSLEMRAIISYLHWVGDEIPRGQSPKGSGIMKIPLLDRAADPQKGAVVFMQKCTVCHQKDGQGLKNADGYGYTYPPLWGEHSFNTGAGLYRIRSFAGYILNTMPFGQADWHHPALSNEEAWDVAAFVLSQPRPEGHFATDWPDIKKKPIDHPFGPYADSFSEKQHKFGPFAPIIKAHPELK